MLARMRPCHHQEKFSNPLKLKDYVCLLDMTIVFTLAMQIILSLLLQAENLQYFCYTADFKLIVKVFVLLWISVGIMLSRLTIVELLQAQRSGLLISKIPSLHVFVGSLMGYSMLSIVVLFMIIPLLRDISGTILCLPDTTAYFSQFISHTLVFGMVAVTTYAFVWIGATQPSFQEKMTTVFQYSDYFISNQPTILGPETITPICAVLFITLFPYVLLETHDDQSALNIYKLFGFYSSVSMLNLVVTKMIGTWTGRQNRMLQYSDI